MKYTSTQNIQKPAFPMRTFNILLNLFITNTKLDELIRGIAWKKWMRSPIFDNYTNYIDATVNIEYQQRQFRFSAQFVNIVILPSLVLIKICLSSRRSNNITKFKYIEVQRHGSNDQLNGTHSQRNKARGSFNATRLQGLA